MVDGECQDLRGSFGIFRKVGGRSESFGDSVSVMKVQVQVHDSGSSLSFDSSPGERHDAEYDVGDVAEPTGSASLGVVSSSIPVDGYIGLACSQ